MATRGCIEIGGTAGRREGGNHHPGAPVAPREGKRGVRRAAKPAYGGGARWAKRGAAEENRADP